MNKKSSTMDLDSWFEVLCDGDWEHQGGISISTLDNPGWHIQVSLNGVDLGIVRRLPSIVKDNGDSDWVHAQYDAETDALDFFCSVGNLNYVVKKICNSVEA